MNNLTKLQESMLRNNCAGKDMHGPPRKAGLFYDPGGHDGLIEKSEDER
jgi:hypothetical protein